MTGWTVGRGTSGAAGIVAADPANVPGWGLPTWRDEMVDRLAYKNANPTLHPINPARWNVRTRANFGLTFDSAIPASENVYLDSSGRMILAGTWLTTPESRTPTAGGPDILTHQTGYVDHRVISGSPSAQPIATRYGRWEMKAKVPTGPNTRGTLPAFWLRNGSTGEIDIMESWGEGGTQASDYHTYVKGRSHFTTFGNTSTAANKTFFRYEDELGIPRLDSTRNHLDFHTWVFEWTSNYMAIYLDGQEAKRITPTDTVLEGSTSVSANKYWSQVAYNSPWHLRINLHIGPSDSFWGVPTPSDRSTTLDSLTKYEIEHVRVWAI